MTVRAVVEGTGAFASTPFANVFHMEGGGGFDASDAQGIADALRTFYNSLAGQFPTGLTWALNAYGVTVIDTATGVPTDRFTPSFTPVLSSGGATKAPAQVASMIKWTTGKPGRGNSGRTYLGPLAGGVVVDNLINSASVTTHQNAANALLTALSADLNRFMVVYHRPRPASPGVSARSGSNTPVIGAVVDSHTETQRRRN